MVTKTTKILLFLQEISSGREINLNSYALNNGLSERTLRRYVSDIRTVFGSDFIEKLGNGNYVCKNKEFYKAFMIPYQKADDTEKLIELLHTINPGFSDFLPPEHKKLGVKLARELGDIFLIKGSPHEESPNLKIFLSVKKAVKFRRYVSFNYEGVWFSDVKFLKIIYSKGNWQVAMIDEKESINNGFRVIRLNFIDEIMLSEKTFHTDFEALKFIQNFETFWDGYKVKPYLCEVFVSDEVLKYFKKKKFFGSQKITEKKDINGFTKIEFMITSDDMILMLARRFFPNFIIKTPKSAKVKFDEMIEKYLKLSKI